MAAGVPGQTGALLKSLDSALPQTTATTLRFVWELHALRDVAGKVNDLRGGFVQSVPVVGAIPGGWNAGRGMQRFRKDLRRHLAAHPA